MADPARNLDSNNNAQGSNAQVPFEVEVGAPQVKSTTVTGGDGQGASSTSIGPSVPANSNDIGNDNGQATSNGASQNSSGPSTSGTPSNTGAGQNTSPSQQTGLNQPESAVAPAVSGDNAQVGTKQAEEPTKNKVQDDKEKVGDAPASEDKKDPEKSNSENTDTNAKETENINKDQQAKAEAAAKDSDPQKAAESQTKSAAPAPNSNPAQQTENQPVVPSPAQARPGVGRRNPLRNNTKPTSTGQSGSNAPSAIAPRSNNTANPTAKSQTAPTGGTSFANKAQDQMRKMADRQSADEKSGKVESDKMTQGPGIDAKKSGSITSQVADSANVEKKVAEGAARRAGAIAGGLGASKGTQQNITVSLITLINIVFLVLEVLSGIGVLLFILHVILFLYWLFTEDRWKHSWMAAAAVFMMPFLSIFGIIAGFCIAIMGTAFIACHQMAESIPFGIPINVVTSIGSIFGANTGPFAQVCDLINVHSAGVGGVSRPHTATPSTTGGATHAVGTINGQVVLVDDNGQTLTPVIAGTQLVRPQPLSAELAAQANQAGYVSPASCKLGEIPYSDAIITRNVRLENGETKLVAFPIHKTIDCIQNDPTKLSVRSVQLGKVVRRVEEDTVLGKYVTVEYPNGLRVSYYHLDAIPDTIALGSVVNAGQSVGTMGKTGQISFTGTQMLFELKDAGGNWQVFNPVRDNADTSILTIFPCAGDSNTKCLLQ